MRDNKYFAVSFFSISLISFMASISASVITLIVLGICLLVSGEDDMESISITTFWLSYLLFMFGLCREANKKPRT